MIRVLLIISIMLVLSGCSTFGKKSSQPPVDEKQLSQMQQQLQEKDLEIKDLKSKVDEMNAEIEKKSTVFVSNPSEKAETVGLNPTVIRVAATTQEVQTALKNAGFYNGVIDGKIGERTKKAIRDFQLANQLKGDGVIGQKTWLKLKSYLNE